jgi:hypothetical protein
MEKMDFFIEDFTEDYYGRLLQAAKLLYDFITYQDLQENKEGVILWRHDVDFSMHRALKLAEIEAEQGVKATYFFYFHSSMYNLMEAEIFKAGQEIIKLGHKIGLHFEPSFYNLNITDDMENFYKHLETEKKWLEYLFKTDVEAFSFHNPDVGEWVRFEEFSVCGMVNTYSRFLKDNFEYCSDSNGYWRFKRLIDVLGGGYKKLHVLLHPEWWVPSAMSPRDRVHRCIDGRRDKCNISYDNALAELGRVNVK